MLCGAKDVKQKHGKLFKGRQTKRKNLAGCWEGSGEATVSFNVCVRILLFFVVASLVWLLCGCGMKRLNWKNKKKKVNPKACGARRCRIRTIKGKEKPRENKHFPCWCCCCSRRGGPLMEKRRAFQWGEIKVSESSFGEDLSVWWFMMMMMLMGLCEIMWKILI